MPLVGVKKGGVGVKNRLVGVLYLVVHISALHLDVSA
jgi:hypothetical protein